MLVTELISVTKLEIILGSVVSKYIVFKMWVTELILTATIIFQMSVTELVSMVSKCISFSS